MMNSMLVKFIDDYTGVVRNGYVSADKLDWLIEYMKKYFSRDSEDELVIKSMLKVNPRIYFDIDFSDVGDKQKLRLAVMVSLLDNSLVPEVLQTIVDREEYFYELVMADKKMVSEVLKHK